MFLLSLTGDLNEFFITPSHGQNLARFFVKMYHAHDTLSPGLPPASENPCAGSLLFVFLLALWSSDSYQNYTLCSTYKHSRPSLEWNSEVFHLLCMKQFQRSKNRVFRCITMLPFLRGNFLCNSLLYLWRHMYIWIWVHKYYSTHTLEGRGHVWEVIFSFNQEFKGLNSGCKTCVASSLICWAISLVPGFLYLLLVLLLCLNTWQIRVMMKEVSMAHNWREYSAS